MLIKDKEYPHRYPPIITQSLFEQIQNHKTNFKKKPFKFAGLPYMYRGLIRCGDCGLSVTPEKHKGLVYYHCTQYKGKHKAKWLREEKVTWHLSRLFRSIQIPHDVLKEITYTLDELHKNKIEFHDKEFDKLMNEQKRLTKMLDNLYLDKLQGRITESEYDRFYQTLKDQSTEISIKLENLQTAEDNYYASSKSVLNLVNRAYDLFIGSEVEEKRQLIKLVLSNLRIEGENLLWMCKSPLI